MKVPTLPIPQDTETLIFGENQSEESLKQIIRGMHLKVTQQRLLILKTLLVGRPHVTAQELYEKINRQDATAGFATVYRFLKSLVDASIVTEVRMGGLPARYEVAPRHHHDHLTCVECGKICEFENKSIENLQTKVAQRFGFILTHHVLELYGICPDCQESGKWGAAKNGQKS